jgi:hypothetical protein
MILSFKLPRRSPRLRAPLLAAWILTVAGCKADDALEPRDAAVTDAVDTLAADDPAVEAIPVDDSTLAAASRRGIPIGHFAQPVSAYGKLFNGGHENFTPGTIVRQLSAIRARGGRVVVAFAGSSRYYVQGGRFSLAKWKARVNRYRGVNLSSFIKDGTLIGHFMIDEPQDRANWRGSQVSPSVLEAMGRHSKQLWPKLATIVRTEPRNLSRNHRYVDAAWAQYLSRKGSPEAYIRRNVAEAQQRRLALVVGLNVLDGGKPNGSRMTAREVKSWGSALLNSSYPCAFISWEYNRRFLSSGGMREAMGALRRKAESRGSKSCRG